MLPRLMVSVPTMRPSPRIVMIASLLMTCASGSSTEILCLANFKPPSVERFFTVPADELYKRIELQQIPRRTRFVTPYAEQLLHRFCNFQARIPLPENHDVAL